MIQDIDFFVYCRVKDGTRYIRKFDQRGHVTNWFLTNTKPKSDLLVAVVRSNWELSEKMGMKEWMSYIRGAYEPQKWERMY